MPHPVLHGSGVIGEPVSAGEAVHWCRDGVPLPGVSGAVYVPVEADDGCVLTALWQGRQSAGLTIRHAPPRVRPLVLDDVFDWLSGVQEIGTHHAFEGRNLRFSLEGQGASIDPVSGRIAVATDAIDAGRRLRVTAQNSGGAAVLEVQVTVEGPEDVAETALTDRLSVDGVTFVFDRPYPVGHFMLGGGGMGDPFVVGPVRLLEYTPAPVTEGPARNGAMLNPDCDSATGFDARAGRDQYKPELNAGLRLPLDLNAGDSLIVARSAPPEATRPSEAIEGFVLLTVLDSTPPADAFRPPFAAGPKPVFRLRDLRIDRLASLQMIGRRQDLRGMMRRFDRFAMDLSPNWLRDHFHAKGHPPLYGRDVCADESVPYIVANSNAPLEDKIPVVAGLVQRGIDRGGVLSNALNRGLMPWQADGAHHGGRKFSIMFTGHLLNVDTMRDIASHVPAPFHEDAMTFYVDAPTVAVSNSEDWRPAYGDKRPQQPYAPAMIGLPEWRGKARTNHSSASWVGNPYRLAGNHNTHHGQVLSLLAMGLREAWGHDAYFDYHMRYMEITAGRPDPWRFRDGAAPLFAPVLGTEEGAFPGWQQYWHDVWSHQMLVHYRDRYYRYPWV